MQLLRNTPSTPYFIAIFLAGSLLFSVFGIVLYFQYRDEQLVTEQTIYKYEVLRQSRAVLLDVLNMETGVRGYLITGQKRFLEPYENSNDRLEAETLRLRNFTSDDPGLRPAIDSILNQIETVKNFLKSQIALLNNSGKDAITTDKMDMQKSQVDGLRKMVDDFIEKSASNLQTQIAVSQAKSKHFLYTLIMGSILAIGAMLLSTLVILSLAARSRRAEMDIKESEKRLLTVMSGINDGLFDIDYEKGTVYYSSAYKEMLGYAEDEFSNTFETFERHVHPDELGEVNESLKKYASREISIYRSIYRMRHKRGGWRWILSRGVGIWNRKGKMTRLIGTHLDITDQKLREEELRQVNIELESFTYITSHDLRSPLVNLKGFAGEMENALAEVRPVIDRIEPTLTDKERTILRSSFDEDIPEALSFIKKSVEKMNTLTNAVLDLSRIGKREHRLEEIDTDTLVRRCIDNLAYEISQKNVEVISEPLPHLLSDLVSLEQVFSNLLDNAIKYLSPERKGKIEIAAQSAGKDIIFSIKDNGRGIEENDQQKVFEIFRRARNTGDVRGLGMGMAYVKATLRKLGGSIWFESIVGKGTTFYFRLPG